MYTVENLLMNSGLPGPRANLSLLYSFAHQATEEEVNACLSFCHDNLNNSPEEFVAVCGIVGYCVLNGHQIRKTLDTVRKYGSTALLLAWTPFIGDALCAAAGWLRLNWVACAFWMGLGKLGRYGVICYLLLAGLGVDAAA